MKYPKKDNYKEGSPKEEARDKMQDKKKKGK